MVSISVDDLLDAAVLERVRVVDGIADAPGGEAAVTLTLVTGGAGFIGSAVVRSLAADGASVAIVDDLSSGGSTTLPRGTRLIERDVALPEVAAVIEELCPTTVVHAAAQISVMRSVADPDRDHAVNVAGTQHVLDGASRAGCRRFVFLSSGGAIYGDADGAMEEATATPVSPYGRNKLAAEALVAASEIPHANARLANVYGPGQRSDQEGGVVAIFAAAAREGRPVAIFGDGEQSRDFVDVADVVSAIRMLMDSPRSGTWNVGTGQATSIHELLATVGEVAGTSIAHEHLDARAGEVRQSRLDIGRIGREIGWRPKMSLREGLGSIVV